MVLTCIFYGDKGRTRTSYWWRHPRPEPQRSSEWAPPVSNHSWADQYAGSRGGWWTSDMDSSLKKKQHTFIYLLFTVVHILYITLVFSGESALDRNHLEKCQSNPAVITFQVEKIYSNFGTDIYFPRQLKPQCEMQICLGESFQTSEGTLTLVPQFYQDVL